MTLVYALTVAVLDRLTKIIVYKEIAPGQSIAVFPDIFHITLVRNFGSAFGLFKNYGHIFTAVSILAIFFIAAYIARHKRIDKFLSLALGLILGGAAGNLIDRAFFGYVIDFLDFRIWPVFNIADSSITVGAFILALYILRQRRF